MINLPKKNSGTDQLIELSDHITKRIFKFIICVYGFVHHSDTLLMY